MPWWITALAVGSTVATVLSGLSWPATQPQRPDTGPPPASTVESLDPFADVAMTVRSLHGRADCLLRAGVWEPFRPDAARFDPALIGAAAPIGRWLDIRQRAPIAAIVDDRLALCVAKGFDGVRFTAIDGYVHDTGFPLTAADQAAFNANLAALARARGLRVTEDLTDGGAGAGSGGMSMTSGS
jgi:hypothetical protein